MVYVVLDFTARADRSLTQPPLTIVSHYSSAARARRRPRGGPARSTVSVGSGSNPPWIAAFAAAAATARGAPPARRSARRCRGPAPALELGDGRLEREGRAASRPRAGGPPRGRAAHPQGELLAGERDVAPAEQGGQSLLGQERPASAGRVGRRQLAGRLPVAVGDLLAGAVADADGERPRRGGVARERIARPTPGRPGDGAVEHGERRAIVSSARRRSPLEPRFARRRALVERRGVDDGGAGDLDGGWRPWRRAAGPPGRSERGAEPGARRSRRSARTSSPANRRTG